MDYKQRDKSTVNICTSMYMWPDQIIKQTSTFSNALKGHSSWNLWIQSQKIKTFLYREVYVGHFMYQHAFTSFSFTNGTDWYKPWVDFTFPPKDWKRKKLNKLNFLLHLHILSVLIRMWSTISYIVYLWINYIEINLYWLYSKLNSIK